VKRRVSHVRELEVGEAYTVVTEARLVPSRTIKWRVDSHDGERAQLVCESSTGAGWPKAGDRTSITGPIDVKVTRVGAERLQERIRQEIELVAREQECDFDDAVMPLSDQHGEHGMAALDAVLEAAARRDERLGITDTTRNVIRAVFEAARPPAQRRPHTTYERPDDVQPDEEGRVV
jgi:hypothetical protein